MWHFYDFLVEMPTNGNVNVEEIIRVLVGLGEIVQIVGWKW